MTPGGSVHRDALVRSPHPVTVDRCIGLARGPFAASRCIGMAHKFSLSGFGWRRGRPATRRVASDREDLSSGPDLAQVHPSLRIPNLKAVVVEPNRSPVIRAHSHRHPLVPRNARSATVTDVSDTMPVPEFDHVVTREAAILKPVPDQIAENDWIHVWQPRVPRCPMEYDVSLIHDPGIT